MVEAKGYWLSVRTDSSSGENDVAPRANEKTKYIVKIHESDSPAVGIARQYDDAINEFKKSLKHIQDTEPAKLPEMADFNSTTMQDNADLAMVFLSEYDIDLVD